MTDDVSARFDRLEADLLVDMEAFIWSSSKSPEALRQELKDIEAREATLGLYRWLCDKR